MIRRRELEADEVFLETVRIHRPRWWDDDR